MTPSGIIYVVEAASADEARETIAADLHDEAACAPADLVVSVAPLEPPPDVEVPAA